MSHIEIEAVDGIKECTTSGDWVLITQNEIYATHLLHTGQITSGDTDARIHLFNTQQELLDYCDEEEIVIPEEEE